MYSGESTVPLSSRRVTSRGRLLHIASRLSLDMKYTVVSDKEVNGQIGELFVVDQIQLESCQT